MTRREEVLLYHVLQGAVVSNGITDGMTETTVQGEDVKFNIVKLYWSLFHWVRVKLLYVNQAAVIQGDVDVSNGVVHVINSVLVPPSFPKDILDTAKGAGLTTLVAAVEAAGLDDVLKSNETFTVFAPNNAAFDALGGLLNYLLANTDELTDILLYHVVPGMAITGDMVDGTASTEGTALDGFDLEIQRTNGTIVINTNESDVVIEDVEVLNGIVHVIDSVLIPSSFDAPPTTLVDLLMGIESLSNLTAALTAYGNLSEVLSGEGPFTVFAPNDDAFAQEDLAGLSEDELVSLLTYHVIEGVYWSSDFIKKRAPFVTRTLNGKYLSVVVDHNGDVILDRSSKVVLADNFAQNGIAHVIDKVLTPCPYKFFFWCWWKGYR